MPVTVTALAAMAAGGPASSASGTLGHCYIELFWLYTTLAM